MPTFFAASRMLLYIEPRGQRADQTAAHRQTMNAAEQTDQHGGKVDSDRVHTGLARRAVMEVTVRGLVGREHGEDENGLALWRLDRADAAACLLRQANGIPFLAQRPMYYSNDNSFVSHHDHASLPT